MIDVKAARRSADAPLSPEKLLARSEQDAPLSMRWPGLLLAIMATAIAFVQNLVGKGEAAMPPHKGQGSQPADEVTAAAVAEEMPDVVKPPAQAEPEDETGSTGDENERAIGSGAPAPAVPGLPDYMGIDSPAFDFEQLPLPVTGPIRPPPAFDEDASNDNGRFFAGGAAGSALTPASSADAAGGTAGVGIGETFIKAAFTLPVRLAEPTDQNQTDQNQPDLPDATDDTPDPSAPERNRAPRVSGALRLADVGPCHAALLTALMLLAGASDADADTLAPRNLTVSQGMLTQNAEGWLYQPQAGYFGQITLSYEISDGQAFVAQTASFDVVEFLRLIGTPQDDVQIGSECNDLIEGLDGDDVIEGRGGKDMILAGSGNDIIHGGTGNDTIDAGAGNDIVFGGSGNDIIRGGFGNDWLHGEDGDDELHGEAGDDWLTGGAGNDRLDGGDGHDRLDGGEGNDHLVGGAGDDEIVGAGGDDVIEAGAGDDLVDGGEGDDSIDGGAGRNTILTGSGRNSVVAGDDGNVVIGGGGADTVRLGSGDDVVRAGGGDDFVDAGVGRNAVFGEDGDDRLVGGAGDDVLDGGAGRDELLGGAGNDTVYGGAGDDTVIVDADFDRDMYSGGSGQDTLDLSALKTETVIDLIKGEIKSAETGNDKISSFEVVIGGAGSDTFLIGDTATTVSGGSGQDKFRFELDGRDAEEDAEELIHKILDLEVGDRIIVSQYTIHEDGDQDDDDRDDFERRYGDDSDDERPFRFRIEKVGENESTFIDVHIANEGEKDFSIEISGNHRFYYYS